MSRIHLIYTWMYKETGYALTRIASRIHLKFNFQTFCEMSSCINIFFSSSSTLLFLLWFVERINFRRACVCVYEKNIRFMRKEEKWLFWRFFSIIEKINKIWCAMAISWIQTNLYFLINDINRFSYHAQSNFNTCWQSYIISDEFRGLKRPHRDINLSYINTFSIIIFVTSVYFNPLTHTKHSFSFLLIVKILVQIT